MSLRPYGGWRMAAWAWPAAILLSAAGAGVASAAAVPAAIRAPVVLWFLLACPGMAYVRLLRLRDELAEWMLAVALSLALDLLVASAMLYAGSWAPDRILLVIIGLSAVGALLQVVPPGTPKLWKR